MAADAGAPLRLLAADLRDDTKRVGGRMAAVVRTTAAAIERDARVAAPVDTGFHRSSITSTITGDGRSSVMTAEIGPTSNYGVFLELGTSKMAARPHLFPALERHAPAFIEAMTQAAEPNL